MSFAQEALCRAVCPEVVGTVGWKAVYWLGRRTPPAVCAAEWFWCWCGVGSCVLFLKCHRSFSTVPRIRLLSIRGAASRIWELLVKRRGAPCGSAGDRCCVWACGMARRARAGRRVSPCARRSMRSSKRSPFSCSFFELLGSIQWWRACHCADYASLLMCRCVCYASTLKQHALKRTCSL